VKNALKGLAEAAFYLVAAASLVFGAGRLAECALRGPIRGDAVTVDPVIRRLDAGQKRGDVPPPAPGR